MQVAGHDGVTGPVPKVQAGLPQWLVEVGALMMARCVCGEGLRGVERFK